MNCIKCGNKTDEKAVFCPDCLAEMEKYPVKPGTVVHIPVRKAEPERKPRRKKEVPLEEQLAQLRKLVRNLTAAILALVTALVVMGGALLYILLQPAATPTQTPEGRNYSTVSTD